MNHPHGFSVPHRTWSTRWLASALAAIIGLLAGAGSVTAHGPDPMVGGKLWTKDKALTFHWRSGSTPTTAISAAILLAAAHATTSRASQAASFAYDDAGPSTIGYGTGATCGVNGLACFTRTPPSSFTMWFREQGHVYDWGTLKWCQAYKTLPNGCYDAQNIALDEFGHVEILGHHENFDDGSDYEDAVVQTFSRPYPQFGWNKHDFGRCDVASLQMQYEVRTWGAKYSTCLDLKTTLALTSSASHVAAGGSVTLTATLKVADVLGYYQLSANPLTARVVTLQKRPRGTSAWTTVGPMSAGTTSGTYTRAVQLSVPTEFRAVFNAPTDEGLRASTSPIVSVTIYPVGPLSCTDTTNQGCRAGAWPLAIAPSNTYSWTSTIDSCPANGSGVAIVVDWGSWTPVSLLHGSVGGGNFVPTLSGTFTTPAFGVGAQGNPNARMGSINYVGRTSVGCHLTFWMAWVSGDSPWP